MVKRAIAAVILAAAVDIHEVPASPKRSEGGRLQPDRIQAPSAEGPFTLGVLRRDGIVIPFASYDGRKWEVPWPLDLRKIELPISIDAIDRRWWGEAPPPRTMTLWADGKAGAELTLLSPATVPFPCAQRLGIRTNYVPAVLPPPASEQPFPKDGLVVTGGRTIQTIARIAHNTPDMRALGTGLYPAFDQAETAAAASFKNWVHPIPQADRTKTPIVMEAAYAAPMDARGWRAVYVEASRRYRPGADDKGCGLVTSVRGWLRLNPQGRYRPELIAEITYCDRQGVGYMLPLGLIRAGDRTHWVYQIAGYEREVYVVAVPTVFGIERVAAYSAALCTR